jgi:hypothetical protein
MEIKYVETCFGTALFSAVRLNDIKLTTLLLQDEGIKDAWLPNEIEQAARNGNNALLQDLFASMRPDRMRRLYFFAVKGATARNKLNTLHFLIEMVNLSLGKKTPTFYLKIAGHSQNISHT